MYDRGLKDKRAAEVWDSFVGCEVRQKAVSCPHCRAIKVVGDGIKKNGRQNLLCKECSKQVQETYLYKGSVPENKGLVLKRLCRGSGVRDCAVGTQVSKGSVLTWIGNLAAAIVIKPQKRCYRRAFRWMSTVVLCRPQRQGSMAALRLCGGGG